MAEDSYLSLTTQERLELLDAAARQRGLAPAVRIELGARSDHWPAEDHTVHSYLSETFDLPMGSARVRSLAAERTFWEKATLLHAEAHRAADKPMPARYDLAEPATFRLLPPEARRPELEADHQAMIPMFFTTPPPIKAVLETLAALESRISGLPSSF